MNEVPLSSAPPTAMFYLTRLDWNFGIQHGIQQTAEFQHDGIQQFYGIQQWIQQFYGIQQLLNWIQQWIQQLLNFNSAVAEFLFGEKFRTDTLAHIDAGDVTVKTCR